MPTILAFISDCQRFHQYMQKFKDGQAVSVFSERTEEASATQYFQVSYWQSIIVFGSQGWKLLSSKACTFLPGIQFVINLCFLNSEHFWIYVWTKQIMLGLYVSAITILAANSYYDGHGCTCWDILPVLPVQNFAVCTYYWLCYLFKIAPQGILSFSFATILFIQQSLFLEIRSLSYSYLCLKLALFGSLWY